VRQRRHNGDTAPASRLHAAVCGDGLVGPGEGCDDGNQVDNDECTNACALATCGDGVVAPTEACDDGNQDDTDACTNNCTNATCGDGFVQPATARSATTAVDNSDNAACTTRLQGQRVRRRQRVQRRRREECDNGADNGPGKACNAMCKLNVCGDGDKAPTRSATTAT
jgi:cysteine-rich repeat protein